MAARSTSKRSLKYRLLNQKTDWQKALLAVAAIVAAMTTIAGGVALVLPLFRGSPDTAAPATPAPAPAATRVDSAVAAASGASPAEVTVVHTQTAEADAFVQKLLDAAGRVPILLNHKILGQPGAADVRLYYACGSTGSCSMTRIQAPQVAGMSKLSGDTGVWFQGCFSVVKIGNGYGADYLDLPLTKVGDRCPT
jgi:hypothetical protein